MRVYNSILVDIKPLVGAAKLHYVDSFDGDFALLLRERKSTSLPVMFQDALELEVFPPKLYLVVFYQVSLVNQTRIACSDFRRPSGSTSGLIELTNKV